MTQIIELTTLKKGQKGSVVYETFDGKNMIRRMQDLGLTEGKEIIMVSANRRGPCLIEVDGNLVAIGNSLAQKIKVQVNSD